MSASQLPTARSSSTERTATAHTQADTQAHTRARTRTGGGETPVVLGRYRLHRRLGAGGFATVWMARDERLDRDVAVKIVPRERVRGGRFEREARAAARLAHPGIVTLYEAAVDDDGAYLVSELVRGETLADLLEAGRLSDRDVVQIAIVLCDALAHAHAQGIVHRDVKPCNVLVPERPASPSQLAKLTDFGVARVIGGDSLTMTGDVIGTAAYMAPEQAEGLEVTAAADLFSLALLTYEALTGVNPVRTGTAAQRARRLGAHLPPLRRQRHDLPRELGRAIDLALRPRPRERGNLAELRAALSQTLPELRDTPGVVGSALPWRDQPEAEREPLELARWSERPVEESADPDLEHEQRQASDWTGRALAAAGTAATTPWLIAHVLAHPPITLPVAALIAALLTAALPRVGWIVATGSVAVAAAGQGLPGASLLIALAALLPIVLLPARGGLWSAAAGAPALALIGLGGAWPALAARTRGPWTRAALGAIGWVWLVLAAPLASRGLYLHERAGIGGLQSWGDSIHQTITAVLRPLLSSGALAPVPVWALAAVTLPWLIRRRSFAADATRVSLWVVTMVVATGSAIAIEHPATGLLAQRTAVIGGIAGGLIALAPRAREAVRNRRARPRFS